MKKLFICDLCNRGFNRKQSLNRHKKRKISCVVKKSTDFQMNTNEHKRTQININKHKILNQCLYCKKGFANNSSLKRHIKSYCKVKKEKEKIELAKKEIEKEQEIDFINNLRKAVDQVNIAHFVLKNEICEIKEEMEIFKGNKSEVIDELYDRDNNIEEVLNIYECINDLKDDVHMDKIQVHFVDKIDKYYDDEDDDKEIKEEMRKIKNKTLNHFYDCYKNNKEKFDSNPVQN